MNSTLTMSALLKRLLAIICAAVFLTAISACDKETHKEVDEAVEETGEAAEELTEDAADGIEDAADEVEETVE